MTWGAAYSLMKLGIYDSWWDVVYRVAGALTSSKMVPDNSDLARASHRAMISLTQSSSTCSLNPQTSSIRDCSGRCTVPYIRCRIRVNIKISYDTTLFPTTTFITTTKNLYNNLNISQHKTPLHGTVQVRRWRTEKYLTTLILVACLI